MLVFLADFPCSGLPAELNRTLPEYHLSIDLYKRIDMNRTFRKYHRFLAPILALPLALTVLTGIAVTITEDWPINTGLSASLLLKIHTGEIFGLEAIYPVLDGVGIIGLIVTGLSMSSVMSRRKPTAPRN